MYPPCKKMHVRAEVPTRSTSGPFLAILCRGFLCHSLENITDPTKYFLEGGGITLRLQISRIDWVVFSWSMVIYWGDFSTSSDLSARKSQSQFASDLNRRRQIGRELRNQND